MNKKDRRDELNFATIARTINKLNNNQLYVLKAPNTHEPEKNPSIRHDIEINKSREIIKMWVDPESVTPTSTLSRNCMKGPLIDFWLNTPPVVADRRDVLLLQPSIPVTGINHLRDTVDPSYWDHFLCWPTPIPVTGIIAAARRCRPSGCPVATTVGPSYCDRPL